MLCPKPNNSGFRYKETQMTSGLVYQHMSSHYRRILNAKPVIDTSAPQTFKPRLTRSGKPRRRPGSSSVVYHQDISKTGSFDDGRLDWPQRDEKSQLKSKQFSSGNRMDRGQVKRERGDLLERHNEQFEAYRLNFCPRILKTDASSKLLGMRVYHPPRRITSFPSTEWTKKSIDKEETAGQASSRDSAYNGGTSSTPDSQSPTCHQKPLPGHVKHVATQTEPKDRTKEQRPKSNDDDVVYTKFIHDIVVEMTEKELFSNSALTQVMFRHYSSHLNSLDKDKMMQEIRKLREKLGMPEIGEDFQSCLVVEPPTFIVPSESIIETSSWTTVYRKLTEGEKSVSSCSDDVQESIKEIVSEPVKKEE